jgi:hypothetical protein
MQATDSNASARASHKGYLIELSTMSVRYQVKYKSSSIDGGMDGHVGSRGIKEGGFRSKNDTINILYTPSSSFQLSKPHRATMATASKLITAALSNACAAATPPSSPSQPLSRHGQSEQLVAFELFAIFKDMLKIAQAQEVPPSPPEVQVSEEEKQPRARASKVEFKLVNEM